mmetsp:Transcript_4076/g.8672  ORF Transcript_4076/g.8672 Transcript_4076/m.8672 type:complete len:86 (-) Transcript_4076:205-462(-)
MLVLGGELRHAPPPMQLPHPTFQRTNPQTSGWFGLGESPTAQSIETQTELGLGPGHHHRGVSEIETQTEASDLAAAAEAAAEAIS